MNGDGGYQAILPIEAVQRPVPRSRTMEAFSQLYGIIHLVVGTVLPLAYVFQMGGAEHADKANPDDFQLWHLDAYYTYLYSASILSIILIHVSGAMRGPHAGHHSHQAASGYILAGAALFGACGMLMIVFRLGSIIDRSCSEICGAINAVEAILGVAFILLLWLFVCAYSNKCVTKWKHLTRVAIMMQWATCMSCWSRDFVREVMVDLMEMSFNASAECELLMTSDNFTTGDLHHTKDVGAETMNFHNFREKSAPFLTPGAMEFYLIMSGFMYVMYGNIGRRVVHQDDPPKKYKNLECSFIGLGMGFLVQIASITAVVATVSSEDNDIDVQTGKPSQIYHGMVLCVYALTIFGNLISHVKMRRSVDWVIDDDKEGALRLTLLLLFVSAGGLFVSATFSIVASFLTLQTVHRPILLLIHECVKVIDIFVQVVFLYDALHRKPPEKFSPNFTRQIMIFLVLTNFMFWWTNIYELKDVDIFPIQYCFYGFKVWSIVIHLTTPLEIYFRFHSSLLYLEIWMSG